MELHTFITIDVVRNYVTNKDPKKDTTKGDLVFTLAQVAALPPHVPIKLFKQSIYPMSDSQTAGSKSDELLHCTLYENFWINWLKIHQFLSDSQIAPTDLNYCPVSYEIILADIIYEIKRSAANLFETENQTPNPSSLTFQ